MSPVLPTSANEPRPRARGFDGSLTFADSSDLLFRLWVSEQQAGGVELDDPLPARVDTGLNPEDMTAAYGRTYSRANLSGGAGLDMLHRQDQENTPNRFWDSHAIDPFGGVERGEQYVARVLPQMVKAADFAASQGDPPLANDQARLALMDSATAIVWYIDINNVGFWFQGVAGAGGSLLYSDENDVSNTGGYDIVSFDGNVFIVGANRDILEYRVSPTWQNYADMPTAGIEFNRLWYAKARLLAAGGTSANRANKLYEVVEGTDTCVEVFTAGRGAITCLTDAGPVLVAGTSDGDIYFAKEGDTGLELAGNQSMVDQRGQVTGLAYAEGFLFVGIAEEQNDQGDVQVGRLLRAEVASSGDGLYTLSNIQLIREWSPASTGRTAPSPTAFSVFDGKVHWAVEGDADNDTEMWAYNLATGGYARWSPFPSGTKNRPRTIIPFNNRIVASLWDDAMYHQNGTLPTVGWIIFPAADHYTSDQKHWFEFNYEVADLNGNPASTIYFRESTNLESLGGTAVGGWTAITSLNASDPNTGVLALSQKSRYHLVMAEIYPSWSPGPGLVSFQVTAYPDPRDVTMRIPINVSDRVEIPGHPPMIVRNWSKTLMAKLNEVEGDIVEAELYDPAVTVRGLVLKVQTPIVHKGPGGDVLVSWLTIKGRRV